MSDQPTTHNDDREIPGLDEDLDQADQDDPRVTGHGDVRSPACSGEARPHGLDRCLEPRHEADLLPGARIAGAAVFVEESLVPGTQALVY